LQELEAELKEQILKNPNKQLDYSLVMKIHEEAARVIQWHYRKRKAEKDEVVREGRFVHRKVQTENAGPVWTMGQDRNKFKKFFFAVFYTYMMMNTVMAEALEKKK